MSDEQQIQAMLKRAFPPSDTELRRDLWPDMLRRIDQHSRAVPWYDWLLIAAAAALVFALPRLLPVLLYNL